MFIIATFNNITVDELLSGSFDALSYMISEIYNSLIQFYPFTILVGGVLTVIAILGFFKLL